MLRRFFVQQGSNAQTYSLLPQYLNRHFQFLDRMDALTRRFILRGGHMCVDRPRDLGANAPHRYESALRRVWNILCWISDMCSLFCGFAPDVYSSFKRLPSKLTACALLCFVHVRNSRE